MAQTTKELMLKITADDDGLKVALSEAEKELSKFESQIKKSNEALKSIGKISGIATTAIGAMGAATVKMASDFNAGFSQVATLIPNSSARIKELQKNVLDLSPAVGKSTSDLTAGLYEIISAFGDSADSAKKLEIAAKAATAGGATTKEAIALLSAVTKGYSDTTAQAQQKVSDLAFMTIKLGQTNMPELASSIQRVTAMSNTLGVSQEELFAVFSSSTGVIGGAAEVSTQLAAVYNELMKPGAELVKTFEALGVASGNELISKFGGLQGALNAIKKVADETGKPINTLFGSVEAGRIALYETGAGAKKFASDLNEMKDAAGSADTAFGETAEGGIASFTFQMEQLKLSAQNLMIKIGDDLTPSIQTLLSPVVKLTSFLSKLDSAGIALVTGAGKVAFALVGTTTAIIGIHFAIDKVKKSLNAVKLAFASNPFGAFIVGVTAAVTALQALSHWLDEVEKKKRDQDEAFIGSAATLAKEAQNVQTLAKEYVNLTAQEELSETQKLRLKEVSEQLNHALGNESGINSESQFLQSASERVAEFTKSIEDSEAKIAQYQEEMKRFEAHTETDSYGVEINFKADEKKLAEFASRIENIKSNIVEMQKGKAALLDFIAEGLPKPDELSVEAKATVELDKTSAAQVKKDISDLLRDLQKAKVKIEASDDNIDLSPFHALENIETFITAQKEKIAQSDEKILDIEKNIVDLREAGTDANADNIASLELEKKAFTEIKQKAQEAADAVDMSANINAVAGKIQSIGSVISNAFGNIAGVARDIIGNKQARLQQELADTLAAIERDKNERLMALETEYLDWKEQKEIEADERSASRAEEKYNREMSDLARNISELQASFAQETNIEKAKNKEKELEAARKQKAEKVAAKKQANEDKKRQKEERQQEIEMLNAKAQSEWEFQVASINAQNAAGAAQANLARQAAAWQKAQSILTLSVQMAVEIAKAAAAYAIPFGAGVPEGIAHTVAATIAGVQIGVVSAAPIPSGEVVVAPLPPAPRPIKFAEGGIVYPSPNGSRFTLPNGSAAVAGEAGIPEIILPVNQANLEAVFKSAGVTNNASNTTIAPVYNISITSEQGNNIGDTVLQTLREHDRELLSLVENTKRMTYVGD